VNDRQADSCEEGINLNDRFLSHGFSFAECIAALAG
jgi:hypothetical protein